MTEGKVLLNAIAKAELAFHVQYGYFVNDGCYYGIRPQYLDINSEGNKYFTMWETMAENNSRLERAKSAVNKLKEGIDYGDYEDFVEIAVGYESPKGIVTLFMTVSSNGGCSDIRNDIMGYYEGGYDDTPTACC